MLPKFQLLAFDILFPSSMMQRVYLSVFNAVSWCLQYLKFFIKCLAWSLMELYATIEFQSSIVAKRNRISNFMCVYTWTKRGCKIFLKKLLEVASGLLLEMNVPVTYWLDVVLTVVYLINRNPSQVLERKSPLQVSQSSAPLFPVPPKIFGCVYFIHILKHQTQNHLSLYF